MKTFEFEEYSKCNFFVSHYCFDEKAIAISIEDSTTSELICKCTTYDIHRDYEVGIATIKNYTENVGMTEFLKKLGIVEEVIKSYILNEDVEDFGDIPIKKETLDVCKINLEVLKSYSKEWKYAEGKER